MPLTDEDVFESFIKNLDDCLKQRSTLKQTKEVRITVEDFTFTCPQLPLMKESDFFKTILTNKNFSDSKNGSLSLKIPDFDLRVFSKIIEFMFDKYTDHHTLFCEGEKGDFRSRKLGLSLTQTNVQAFMEMASYLQVKDISDVCSIFMVDNLDRDNILDVVQLSSRLNLSKLIEKSKYYLGYHLETILDNKKSLEISEEIIILVLSLEISTITDECLLLKFLISWVKCNFKERYKTFPKLFGLIKRKFISETRLNKYLLKVLKLYNSTHYDIVGKEYAEHVKISLDSQVEHLDYKPRSWPQIIVLGDSLGEVVNDLDCPLLSAKRTQLIFPYSKDVESGKWSKKPLLPPITSLLEESPPIRFAGSGSKIFMAVNYKSNNDEEEDSEITIWKLDMFCDTSVWTEMPYSDLESSEFQLTFSDNILYIAGMEDRFFRIRFYDFDEYEPEWRNFPMPEDSHSHFLMNNFGARLCTETFSKVTGNNVLWLVLKGNGMPHKISDSLMKQIPSGKRLHIKIIVDIQTDIVEGHSLLPSKHGLLAVGGHFPASKKSFLYDENSSCWSQQFEWNLNEGRGEPAILQVDGQIHVFGGMGFYLYEKVQSIEKLNEELNKWEKDEKVLDDTIGLFTAMAINKPHNMILK